MTILTQRREFSLIRLAELRRAIEALEGFRSLSGICVYTTGSYGRLEASPQSDLDLFFIAQSAQEPPSRIGKILLDADLIRVTRQLGLPDFSGDGEYLVIHSLGEMERYLGAPEDDYKNFFTARLLLLLESRPIANEAIYDAVVDHIIQWYFRDYEDHSAEFMPVFLTNDIIRFWKTLCLNYESRRNALPAHEPRRAKHRLKNLKLKFSRMTTCLSTLIAVSAQPSLSPAELAHIVKISPWERLAGVVERNGNQSILDELMDHYDWFLGFVGREEAAVLAELSEPHARENAFKIADAFGAKMYMLFDAVTDRSVRRYLLV
jgi:hypothetical protein